MHLIKLAWSVCCTDSFCSVCRYIATFYHLAYLRTIQVGKFVCVLIWVISLAIATPYLIFAQAEQVSGGRRPTPETGSENGAAAEVGVDVGVTASGAAAAASSVTSRERCGLAWPPGDNQLVYMRAWTYFQLLIGASCFSGSRLCF